MYEALIQRLQLLARRAGLKDVPPAVLVAILLVSVATVCWALWHWWPQSAEGEVVFESTSDGGAVATLDSTRAILASGAATGTQPAATETCGLVVHVVGCVRHPGVYELAQGSRVIDAVECAGGTLPDAVLSAINLARVLSDGEQILVPDEDDPAETAGPAGGGAAGGLPGGGAGAQVASVNINSADAAALETLPGVGPSTAAKIIADREANGPYASVEDLGRVSGIGPKKLEQLKGAACVR
jgi:competence protein ComEA